MEYGAKEMEDYFNRRRSAVVNRLNDYVDAASNKLASVEKQLAKVNKRRCQGPAYEKKLSKMWEKYCKKQRKMIGQKRIPGGTKLCTHGIKIKVMVKFVKTV